MHRCVLYAQKRWFYNLYWKKQEHKKRLVQHFSNDNRKSKKIQLDVVSVSYEKTGNDLIAQLKECEEIKQLKPIFNHALKRSLFQYQLTSFSDDNGYVNLKIEKAISENNKDTGIITTFTNYQQAKAVLFKITDEYQLCQKLNNLQKTDGSCFNYSIKQCKGACIEDEEIIEYNKRINRFIENNSYKDQSMLIIDRGRDVDERSVILIENGTYRGYGYFNLNFQITNPEILKSVINPMTNDRDTQHIIQGYLRKNKVMKIVKLT